MTGIMFFARLRCVTSRAKRDNLSWESGKFFNSCPDVKLAENRERSLFAKYRVGTRLVPIPIPGTVPTRMKPPEGDLLERAPWAFIGCIGLPASPNTKYWIKWQPCITPVFSIAVPTQKVTKVLREVGVVVVIEHDVGSCRAC